MKKVAACLVLIAVVICAAMLCPLIVLWSLNTISGMAGFGWYIPHNVWTYLAVIAVVAVLRSGRK